MALPIFRGCCRLPVTSSINRLLVKERFLVSLPGRTRPLPFFAPGVVAAAAAVRPYSSDPDKRKHLVISVGILNPFKWFRARIYCFLIRAYFDKEFTIEEFTTGAKQAFSHVSTLLSRCQFEALEGLVAEDLIGKLEEKCNLLPSSHKKALYADTDEIIRTTFENVDIYYGDNGRKVVVILMQFWYLSNAHLPEDTQQSFRIFQIAGEGEATPKTVLTADYVFQREFTKEVESDWIITKIVHSKLLD